MNAGNRGSMPLEGDYLETAEGLFFAVKGIHHPPGLTIAYLRYMPDPDGERTRKGKRYTRLYDIEATEEILRRNHPQYINRVEGKSLVLQTVPDDRILNRFDPRERLGEIIDKPESDLHRTIAKLAESLRRKGVSLGAMGVSGSVLIELDGPDSDVDIIVYGMGEGRKAFESLKELREEAWLTGYDEENVMGVVRSRWADTGFDLDIFRASEAGKILHGRVDGRDYFFRLLRLPHEAEAEDESRPLGVVRLRARVTDSEGAIYAPCSYGIDECEYLDSCGLPIASELLSFRGKFTEQAEEGDIVEARGTLEEAVRTGERRFRVVLGRKGDYLIPGDS